MKTFTTEWISSNEKVIVRFNREKTPNHPCEATSAPITTVVQDIHQLQFIRLQGCRSVSTGSSRFSLSGYRAVRLSVQEVPDLVSLSGYMAVHLSAQEVPDLVSLSGYSVWVCEHRKFRIQCQSRCDFIHGVQEQSGCSRETVQQW